MTPEAPGGGGTPEAMVKAKEIVTAWFREQWPGSSNLGVHVDCDYKKLTKQIALALARLDAEHSKSILTCQVAALEKDEEIRRLKDLEKGAEYIEGITLQENLDLRAQVQEQEASLRWLITALKSTAPATWSGWSIVAEVEATLAARKP